MTGLGPVPVELGQRRIDESNRALNGAGFDVKRLHLPDGRLSEYTYPAAAHLAQLVIDHGIDGIISNDKIGYDGHVDHIETYTISCLATWLIADRTGKKPHHWALHSNHAGRIRVNGSPQDKLRTLSAHSSQGLAVADTGQFAVARNKRGRQFSGVYGPLLRTETYDLVT